MQYAAGNIISDFFSKGEKMRKQMKLDDFRNNFGISGNCINVFKYVNEPTDSPFIALLDKVP